MFYVTCTAVNASAQPQVRASFKRSSKMRIGGQRQKGSSRVRIPAGDPAPDLVATAPEQDASGDLAVTFRRSPGPIRPE